MDASEGVIHYVYDEATGRLARTYTDHAKTDYGYDERGRLTGETRDEGNDAVQNGGDYADTFAFDLAGNRVSKTHNAVGTTNDETITSSYNDRDQLTAEDSTVNANDKTYAYDANGSQTSVAHNGQTDTYGYDLRNKMVSVTKGGVTSTYVYDGAGNRVAETSGGATTYYLTDANNPTGYDQPIEEKSNPTGSPTRSYVLGQSVLGQSNATSGTVYFLTDGHGSTRGLIDSTGSVTSSFEYDAFGGAIGFNPAGAATPFLFGGDAIYDPASGLYLHGNGVRGRDGFRFIQADELGNGRNGEPISLHKYMYGNGNPVGNIDPSGNFSVTNLLVTTGINAALYAVGFGSIKFAFAKARGLSTAAAFREGLAAAGWGALLAVPVVGHVLGGIGLYQTAQGLANGDFDEMDRLELAVNLAASLLLSRGGASLGRWATAPSVNAPPPGTTLALPQRLTLIFSRMKNEPPARSPQEAHATLSRIMKEVEDGYSGVAENPNPGLARDGRMYPPKADFIKESSTGAWIATSRGHKTIFHKDGSITIINRTTGQVEFHDGPSPMNPLYTNDGD